MLPMHIHEHGQCARAVCESTENDGDDVTGLCPGFSFVSILFVFDAFLFKIGSFGNGISKNLIQPMSYFSRYNCEPVF